MQKKINISITGNPNSGKSSLFNSLTGLHQKVGNFPGVTVEKKTGTSVLTSGITLHITDLPGTYSLYPKREDEWVAYRMLMNPPENEIPGIVIIVADASNLKRNLLFCSQIIDLKFPVIIALTMMDLCRKKGIVIDVDELQREMGVPVIAINPRTGKGISELKRSIEQVMEQSFVPSKDFIPCVEAAVPAVQAIRLKVPGIPEYKALHYAVNMEGLNLAKELKDKISKAVSAVPFNKTKCQADEIMQRYGRIRQVMHNVATEPDPRQKELFSERLDNVLLHRKWGYLILLVVLFLLFQSVFFVAQYPMDWIEKGFGALSGWLNDHMTHNWFSNLLINGVVAGLSGIMVFVPQIMILFGLITILEDTGYMARISFLSDKLMRKAGLNGKSVMPLISGYACAVPAIMSARGIENKKERLLTILVTPLMSCSARLPVYTILISLVVRSQLVFGFISLQGLVMMGLYLGGTIMAFTAAWVMKWFIHTRERSFFILELPVYRGPRWNNIIHTMLQKGKIFVRDAGKVIMIISLILWGLSNFGPTQRMQAVNTKYDSLIQQLPDQREELERKKKTAILENSYAGIVGRAIEPVLTPLGYDWKIGIALVTSFAAREVFVGTMATLYSVNESNEESHNTLRQKMDAAVKPDGTKVYTLATGVSLMIFYMLAMQCMSTLAVVRRETGGWKWPGIQLLYMTGLAYLFSWLAYLIFK